MIRIGRAKVMDVGVTRGVSFSALAVCPGNGLAISAEMGAPCPGNGLGVPIKPWVLYSVIFNVLADPS